MTKNQIVFPKADIQFLESAAKQVGLDVYVPGDIKIAQKFKPRTEGELEPVEAYLLLKIAEHIEGGGAIPEGFAVYLNDRANSKIEEDVPTSVWRKSGYARNELSEAVNESSSSAQERK